MLSQEERRQRARECVWRHMKKKRHAMTEAEKEKEGEVKAVWPA